jgi:hypothetical protein
MQVNLTGRDYVTWYARAGQFPGMSGCSVRRSAWQAVGGMDEGQTRRHDLEFWLRLVRPAEGRTWAWDPQLSTSYRSGRPGNISSQVASAERFRLIAFRKNRDAYTGDSEPAMVAMLEDAARSAMSGALTDGTAADRHETWPLAVDHLSPGDKRLFSVVRHVPWAFALLNRLRRRGLRG